MEVKDFNQAEMSGRLVQSSYSGESYYAFVPHDLPPKFDFDRDIVNLLSKADRSIGPLTSPGIKPYYSLLFSLLLRREAIRSSRIEGTLTTLSELVAHEVQQLSAERKSGKGTEGDEDRQEVLNYVNAMQLGVEKLRETALSQNLIKDLHAQLLSGVIRGRSKSPGVYRRVLVGIGSEGQNVNTTTFVPAPPQDMRQGMNQLEIYLNENTDHPPLIRLAFLHYQFEALHPFLDGNGRIGRLLLPLTLMDWGDLSAPIFFLSVYFEKTRAEYYDRLLAVSQKGDWRGWVEYFLKAVIDQADETINKLELLGQVKDQWTRQLSGPRTSQNLILTMNSLFEKSPAVTTRTVSELTGLTDHGARYIIKKLREEKILFVLNDNQQSIIYGAPQILSILEE